MPFQLLSVSTFNLQYSLGFRISCFVFISPQRDFIHFTPIFLAGFTFFSILQ